MWFDVFAINLFALFAGVLHSVEMRLPKKLRKLLCYFKWYIYTPYWHWIYIPLFTIYRPIRRPIRRAWRNSVIAFWLFVEAVEKSPTTISEGSVKAYKRIKRVLMSIPGMPTLVKWVKAVLRVYFKIVNFRRLLLAFIVADMFIYKWTDTQLDPDLRAWNTCVLTLFFNVLYLLMDGADGKVRLYSHDFFTRFYLKRVLKITPEPELTEEQMRDSVLARYIKLRHMRNAYICIIGFLYTGQPLLKT